ncbi:unnamed protein product [Rhizophagus irregularis]|nr:unnamed protein product [Rhizophagus irregularis]
MAGYAPPSFSGNYDEDIDYFINEFRRYLTASGNNLANNADRVSALGFFKSCLKGKAAEWLEREIADKNWELSNILSTVNVNLAGLQGAAAGAITGHLSNNAPPGLNAQLTAAAAGAGALVVPAHTVFGENWLSAGGRPTHLPICLPNANLANRTVVLNSITLGLLIDYFEREYTTARQRQHEALFGITVQGADSVGSYYSKLKKIARHANMGDDEFRRRFIGGLVPENQVEVRRMGLRKPINEILSNLEELERYKSELPAGLNPTLQVWPPSSQTYTSADIDRIINKKIQAMQRSYIPSQPVPSPAPVPVSMPVPEPDPKYVSSYQKMLGLARRLGMNQGLLYNSSIQEIEAFIDEQLSHNLPQNHDYHGNVNMHITRVNNSFGDEYKRSYATKSSQPSQSSRKCSNCGKSGHTKSSCPKSKRGKKKTNYAHDTSDSADSSDSSDSSDSDSDSGHACYGLKKKPVEKKHIDKKVVDKKKSRLERQHIIFEVFIQLLKLLVQSFVNAVPKESVISAYNALNAEFINYKEPVLSQLKGEPSIKTREKVWDNVKDLFTSILHPMISVVTNSMAANLIRKNDDVICNNDLWSSIAGIGIVNRKSASDVVTIKTKVVAPESEKSLVIPTTIFDTGSDSSLISNNIVKRLNLDVDRSNAPDLSGVATKSDTIGTVYGLGILVYDGENSKKIEDDFMVVKSDKDFLLLGVPWIDHANVILDFQNRQLTIPLSSRKKITIPISLHKRKTNVTSLQMDTIDLKKIHTLEED